LTSIVITHDVSEVLTIADYAYILADKKIIGAGTPDEIRNSSSERVQQFLQGNADGPVPFHFPAPTMQETFMGTK
jgi:phospholipid/cholesterol/gamma-HCH transport system ATP-binding protein